METTDLIREVATLSEQVKHLGQTIEKSLQGIKDEVDQIRASNENFRNIHDMQERQRTSEIFDRIVKTEDRIGAIDSRVKLLEEIPKVKDAGPWGKLKSKVQENLINAVSVLVVGGLAFFAWQYLSTLQY